ncbi:hypothetical protein [Levilactobacillus bambusae]|uniref:Uncharacterized protein n=1 Tax=Levilactobacillus bambusae TaxID=2024736 RepID=A0A2V1MXU3_9LACO|nr:hypothetical protein [Levilactobacillus bambusae]PWF99818.1 hypothetical protein DCM90_07090 [Levilactobacillus bambusae]
MENNVLLAWKRLTSRNFADQVSQKWRRRLTWIVLVSPVILLGLALVGFQRTSNWLNDFYFFLLADYFCLVFGRRHIRFIWSLILGTLCAMGCILLLTFWISWVTGQ